MLKRIIVCDACGKQIKVSRDHYIINICKHNNKVILRSVDSYDLQKGYSFDLCSDCIRNLVEALSNILERINANQ